MGFWQITGSLYLAASLTKGAWASISVMISTKSSFSFLSKLLYISVNAWHAKPGGYLLCSRNRPVINCHQLHPSNLKPGGDLVG